jgi:hypothetical protein
MKQKNNLLSNRVRARNTIYSMYFLALLITTLFVFGTSIPSANVGYLLIALILCAFCVFAICYYHWLFRAYENIGKLTETKYSPQKAVLLSIVPFVNLVYSFLVLLEIFRKLSSVIKANELESLDISQDFIKFFWVFCFIMPLTPVPFFCLYWIVVKFQEGFAQIEALSEITLPETG